jgi:hypothetical protein
MSRPRIGCLQPHGTLARYTAGCSCFDCCEAKNAYQRAYRVLGGNRLADAEPMRLHIERLKRAGWSDRAIAEQAAISHNTVRYVRTGRRVRVRQESVDAVLTLSIAPLATPSTALVPARHTLRLIDRLRRDYSRKAIAYAAGLSPTSLPRNGQRSVQARTALRIRDAAKLLRGAGEVA